MKKGNYGKFTLMLCISFVIMYGVMFLNVADTSHIYLSTTRLYMTLLMVSPMALLMLGMMGGMYPNKKLNAGIGIAAIVIFAASLYGLRTQAFIGNEQYMQAMIPHHSSAILTSKNAYIKDPKVKQLSIDIIKAQEREIAEMKAMLQRLDEADK